MAVPRNGKDNVDHVRQAGDGNTASGPVGGRSCDHFDLSEWDRVCVQTSLHGSEKIKRQSGSDDQGMRHLNGFSNGCHSVSGKDCIDATHQSTCWRKKMIRWLFVCLRIERLPTDDQIERETQAVREASQALLGATNQLLRTIDEVHQTLLDGQQRNKRIS